MSYDKSIPERFWSKVKVGGPDECWNWTGTKYNGYGRMYRGKCPKGHLIGAHRYSYLLHFGAILGGLDVLHRCDNPSCVNPSHLWLGTHADNMADMKRKGRYRNGVYDHPERLKRGSSCHLSRITEDDVRAIRASTAPVKEIAAQWGMSTVNIYMIRLRRSWKHV